MVFRLIKRVFLMAVVFSCVSTIVVVANSTPSQADIDEFMRFMEIMQRQSDAVKIAEQLDESFPIGRNGEIIYPDYYAGSYFDDNKLVIVVTDDSFILQGNSVFSPFIDSDTVIFKLADYSYFELNEVFELLGPEVDKRLAVSCEYALNIVGYGLNSEQNRIVVGLEYLTEEKIDGFRTYIMDSPMIIFTERRRHELLIPVETYERDEEHIVPYSTIINPGERVATRALFLNPVGTMGYRARLNGVVGFITAAHIFDNVGQRVYPNSAFATHLGVVERRVLDGRIDASFVATNITPGNTLPTGFTLGTQVVQSFRRDQSVLMFGATTGSSIGQIREPNYNITIGDIRVQGAVWTTVVAERGDSGGIVVMAPYSITDIQIAGIVFGGAPGFPDMIFVPAHIINRIIGVTPF